MTTAKRSHKKKPTTTKQPAVKFNPLTAPPAPVLTNHVVLVLDSSGSMGSLRDSTIAAFNQNVENIKAEAKKSGQKTTVSLVVLGESNANPSKFGGYTERYGWSYGSNTPKYPDVNVRCIAQPVETLQPLTRSTYVPSGGTPLFDAVGLAIEEAFKFTDVNDQNTSFVFFVQTDGQEQHSKVYTSGTLMQKIQTQQKTDRWTFGFLVPKNEGAKLVANFGIPAGNVSEWETNAQGMTDSIATTSNAVSGYFNARSTGQRSVKNLFTVEAANLSKTLVKKELTDLSKMVVEWSVDRDGESIQEFVTRKNKGIWTNGAGFYELRKPEVIQASKQIMIKDRTTGKIYGGPEARDLLSLPTHEVKVKPGQFGNWDVFVQSTSHNRKLGLSTKLLYRTDITTDLKHTWVDPTKVAKP